MLVLCEWRGKFSAEYIAERSIIYVFGSIAETLAGPKIP